jgi:hypothetical protein
MKHLGLWVIAASVMTTTVFAEAQPAPGPYPAPSPNDNGSLGGYSAPAIPDLFSGAAQMLAVIRDVGDRNMLAQEWLTFLKKVIVEDMEYRAQWLELQKQQMAQVRQVEELRLEVARLQWQVEQLRARNAQLERRNRPRPGTESGGAPTAVPREPASQEVE